MKPFVLVGFLAALLMMPGSVAASCAVSSLGEHVAMAQYIVQGTVSAVDQRSKETYYVVDLERVYKGQPRNPLVVYMGSGRNMSSSVDFPLSNGVEYTLYLRINQDGYYQTSACTGSHKGKPTAEELQLLGDGQAPPAPQPLESEASGFGLRFWIPFIALGAAVGGMGAVLWSVRRRGKTGA